MISLLLRAKEYATLALAALVGGFLLYWRGVRSGKSAEAIKAEARRNAEQAAASEAHVQKVNVAQEKRREVDSLPDVDVADRLRRWTRDKGD